VGQLWRNVGYSIQGTDISSARDYGLALLARRRDEYSCMKHADKYERLAQLTGFPNLATVNDPERLERLVGNAESSLAHCTLRCPLRYQVALREYGEAALYKLENPEEL
jgi:bacterioferritin (cytochrome b1)